MPELIIDDVLWARIAPIVAPFSKSRSMRGGREPVSDRAAMVGILFVLRTGIRWNALPRDLGAGSGVSCWRRLRYWQSIGVWAALQDVLRECEPGGTPIDFTRTARGRRPLQRLPSR
ncbi:MULTISPECIES: transposase [unclassified Cupriavidus]|uniref:transposase n=1 Tax=Cupriavidus sp. H19C3 TaxID=3241603 RepID=UPI003BF81CAA